MRPPTLLELIVLCCIVALVAGLLLPARQPQEHKPHIDGVLQVFLIVSVALAALGAAVLAAWHAVRWVRSRSHGPGGVP